MNLAHNVTRICAAWILGGGILWAESVRVPIRDCEVFQFHEDQPTRVELKGSSNAHNWSAHSEGLTLVGDDAPGLEALARLVGKKAGASDTDEPADILFSLPVSTLTSTNTRMLRDLKKAVGHPEHPHILYRLLSVSPMEEGKDSWNVAGLISVAGQEYEISHQIQVRNGEPQQWVVRGELDLQMTWFGISPPRALMGLVRANNNFQVKFEVHVQTVCTLETQIMETATTKRR